MKSDIGLSTISMLHLRHNGFDFDYNVSGDVFLNEKTLISTVLTRPMELDIGITIILILDLSRDLNKKISFLAISIFMEIF